MSRIDDIGGRISRAVARTAEHPAAQAGVVVFCSGWVAIGGVGSIGVLSLILSVAAITLSQMVLNQQKRQDAALHLKLDELIYAKQGARDELARIEQASTEHVESLRRRPAGE